MSLYKDASLVMIPTAYKDGKLYSVRPVEQLGSELVTNGDFSSASDWTFSGSGVAISGGKLNFTGTTREATQSISVVNTKTYRVSYEVSNFSAGSVRAEIGSSIGIERTANGIYSEYIVASGANTIEIDAVSVFTGSIDNVSVKEVLVANGDFDFSRGSNLAATRVDVNGLIEKGRENLLLQSNSFNNWTNYLTTETSGQADRNGANTAWLLEKTGSGGSIYRTHSTSGVNTFSAYVKAGTLNWVRMDFTGGGSKGYFDLQNGVVGSVTGSPIDSAIEDAGNGWYRCSITTTSTGTGVGIIPAENDGSVGGTSGNIYIQDAQLESSMVATDYIETGASTAQAGILEDMPRLDYSGGASCPSLLLEPQRLNKMYQSEYLRVGSGASGAFDWSNTYVTLTSNNATSPDGYQNATKMETTSANGSAESYVSYTASSTNTMSLFVKAGTSSSFSLFHIATGGTGEVTFNLTNGTFTRRDELDSSATITDYGNDWWRITMTYTAGTGAYISRLRVNGVGYVHIFGWQIEEGSYPTSYIPTYGTATTRGQEFPILGGDLQAKGIFSTRWTFLYDQTFVDVQRDGANALLLYQDLGGTNNVRLSLNSDGSYRLQDSENGVTGNTSGNKILCRFDGSTIDWYIDGVQVASDSVTPSNFEAISVDNRSSATLKPVRLNQHLIFPTALTDSECIALTTL
jgi:hypothetical protein